MGTDLDVLQVITSTVPRGAERFALALQPELIARGLRVETVALVRGKPHGLDVDVLGTRRLGPTTLRELRRRARRAHVVAAHGSTTLPASALACAGTDVPFIYRNIGDPHYWGTTRRRRLQSRLLLGRAAAVVALTDETASRLSRSYGLDRSRVTVIPRGVSADDFPPRTPQRRAAARAELGIDDDARVAICVGALSPEKDIPTAIRAIGHLDDRWRLLVAGDGPDRPTVEAAAGTLDPGRVRLLGAIDDVAGLMAAADVLVLPSRTEGLPGVIIEAAMVGLPSVSTTVGFVTEIIDDGTTGTLVDVGDPRSMAAAIAGMEDRLDEMGAAARRHAVETFSLASTAEAWERLLRSHLGTRTAGVAP